MTQIVKFTHRSGETILAAPKTPKDDLEADIQDKLQGKKEDEFDFLRMKLIERKDLMGETVFQDTGQIINLRKSALDTFVVEDIELRGD